MPKYSTAIEDYLKHIWLLTERGISVTGKQLADALNVAPASVTQMMKRLDALQLVEYEPYRTIRLTPAGQLIAVEMVRHHRLIELYLSDVVGMSWDEVHDEAEVLEHHISERLEALMAERLGFPQFDPHGDPIPAVDGTLPAFDASPLASAAVGQMLEVARVRDARPDVLRYLSELGIEIGVSIQITAASPVGDTITVEVAGASHVLGHDLARIIEVRTHGAALLQNSTSTESTVA